MGKMLRKIVTFSIVVLLFFSFYTMVAEAYTVAFTYEGWGIRSRPSLSQTYIQSPQFILINHTQTKIYPAPTASMEVIIQKQNLWGGFDDVTSTIYNENVSNANWPVAVSEGTYRLYFKAYSANEVNAYDIVRSFNK